MPLRWWIEHGCAWGSMVAGQVLSLFLVPAANRAFDIVPKNFIWIATIACGFVLGFAILLILIGIILILQRLGLVGTSDSGEMW